MSDTFWGSYSNALGALGQVRGQITNRRAGARLAQNDYRGAANEYFNAGDVGAGNALVATDQQRRQTEAAEQLAFTLQATRALRRARAEGGDVLAAYDQYAPAFQQMGATPEQVQQLRGQLQQNPEAFLDSIDNIVGQQQRELQFQKTGDNLLVFEQGNPDPIRRFEAPRQPIEVGGVLVDPNTYEPILDTREPRYQTVQNSDGTTSVVAIDQPAPVSSGGGGGAAPSGGVDPVSVIQELIPGVTFNSGLRTPDQNRAARGSERSYHLSGMAVDIPPQRGRDIEEFRRELEARGVNVRELIDEGNHWHIAWEGGRAAPNFGRGEAPRSGGVRGGTRVVAQGQPGGAAQTQTLTPQEVADLGLPEGTIAQRRRDGSLSVVSRGGERYTEGQRNAAYFYRRLSGARDELAGLAARGINRPSPAILAFGEGRIRENALSPSDRQWLQAARNWLAPILRKDTGAAITPPEVVFYMGEYLASPTDDPTTIAQKARARARAEDALRGLAGGAYQELFPEAARSERRGRGNGTGLPFDPSPAQSRTRQSLIQQGASPSAPLGSARNPRYLNPQDPASGWSNARSGDYVVRPDGRVVRKP